MPRIPKAEGDPAILDALCTRKKTREMGLHYLVILRKLTAQTPRELPDGFQYISAFLASEQLQNGDVRGSKAIEQANTESKTFWQHVGNVQNLLCEAALNSCGNSFSYVKLPEWRPRCTYCRSRKLSCLKTARISFKSAIDPDNNPCQACSARGRDCKRAVPAAAEVDSAGRLDDDVQDITPFSRAKGRLTRNTDADEPVIALPSPRALLSPLAHKATIRQKTDVKMLVDHHVGIRNAKTPTGSQSPAAASSEVATKGTTTPAADIDSEDDTPITVLRKRSPSDAALGGDKDSKKQKLSVNVADLLFDPAGDLQNAADSVSTSKVVNATVSLTISSSVTRSAAASQEQIDYVALLLEMGREIVEHVKDKGCRSLMVKLAIEDLAATLQEFIPTNWDSKLLTQALSELDGVAFVKRKHSLTFACERIIRIAGRVDDQDDELLFLLAALHRRLALSEGLTS